MKIVSVINLKGGTGKTTTVVNLAYLLKEKGNRVLVIDNDKQSNTTKLFLGEEFDVDEENGLYELLMNEENVNDCIHKSKYEGIDVISSGVKLRKADINIEIADIEDKYLILKNKLNEVNSRYDFVLIDNPPDINALVYNTIASSNDVIITVCSSDSDIDGAIEIRQVIKKINAMYDLEVNIAGVLQTSVGRGRISKLTRSVLDSLGFEVFECYIRNSCKVAEAGSLHKALEDYAHKSTSAQDYRNFLQEYLHKNC